MIPLALNTKRLLSASSPMKNTHPISAGTARARFGSEVPSASPDALELSLSAQEKTLMTGLLTKLEQASPQITFKHGATPGDPGSIQNIKINIGGKDYQYRVLRHLSHLTDPNGYEKDAQFHHYTIELTSAAKPEVQIKIHPISVAYSRPDQWRATASNHPGNGFLMKVMMLSAF